MAQFEILTDQGSFLYETAPARLLGPDGARVDLSRFAYTYVGGSFRDDGSAFGPAAPVIGKTAPRILKIQLGLGCNMACSYCSQGGQQEVGSSIGDAVRFVENLDWLQAEPQKIEFWGGEPLLYWKKLEVLAPALRVRFPKARMSIVTNGTLLTMARAQWLYDLGFTMAVSHDGPGQALRGDDPFEDADWREMIRAVFKLFGERAAFNSVITPRNIDLFETWMWFEDRMGFTVTVNIEDVVTDYGNAKWSAADLARLAASIRKHVASGLALMFPRLRWAAQQFMETLAIEKALDGSHQVCGMDRRDYLAVDLHGNVLTCQNAGADSGHAIGAVSDLGSVALTTSQSWAGRPNCRSCPVVHLCYGSCMFLEGAAFESSCHASYHYNRAVLEGIIQLLTGATVTSISGWRPRKIIPIEVAT